MENNDLAEHIKRIENDLIAMKTSQPIGSDSVLTFSTQTNNIWDFEFAPVSTGDGAIARGVRLSVRMLCHNQDAPFGRIRFFAEYNGAPYDYKTPANWRFTAKGPYIMCSDDFLYASSNEMANARLLRFMIDITVPIGGVLKLKYVIDATDTGRVYSYV